MTPIRAFRQLFCATGANVTIPGFSGLTVRLTTPARFEGLDTSLIVEPLILTRTPCTGLPFCRTLTRSVVGRPTTSDRGVTASAVQYLTGGTKRPFTCTCAEAVLFAVFVSASFPTTVAVFVIVPVTLDFVTTVIVAVAPAGMLPIAQSSIVPPVHAAWLELAETNVMPAGTGSATFTPVATSGPLFFTVSVQVTWSPRVDALGLADFVIARSIVGAAGGWGVGDG
jgi:hypothetical protein